MFWLPRQWRRKFLPATGPARRRPTARPRVDELESRVVPTLGITDFINHGGPVLAHVRVEAVFYGQQWQDPSLAATRQQITDYLSYITGSPFIDILAQYGVGHGQLTDGKIVADTIGNNVTPDAIVNMLDQRIGDGTLDPADASSRLYFVFTPPNVTVNDNPGTQVDFLGYHSELIDSRGSTDAYAVIPYPGGPNPQVNNVSLFDSITAVSSHELAEAVTDPYQAGGNPLGYDSYSFDPSGNKFQGEVGDICANMPVVYLNNYAVVQVYSAQTDDCAAPQGGTTAPSNGQLQVAAQPIRGVAGQPIQGAVLAVITDTNPQTPRLSAAVDWGDGSGPDTNVQVVGPDMNGQYEVVGTHQYGQDGQYAVTVTVTDAASGDQASDTGTAIISPAGQTPLQLKAEYVTAAVGTPFAGEVAQGSDPGGLSGDVYAMIDWGDGSFPDVVPVNFTDAQGDFTVTADQAPHTYGAGGSYALTVTVLDFDTGEQATDVGTANVGGASALAVQAQPFQATAGTPFDGTVALVSDPGVSASALTATIDWGDGTPTSPDVTSGTVTTDPSGNLLVRGAHSYANPGAYPVTVTVSNPTTGDQAQDFSLADVVPATGGATLTLTPLDITPTAGQQFTRDLAIVQDPSATSANDLLATIDWGDGTVQSGVPLTQVNGQLVVAGTHTYQNAQQYVITVTVDDINTGAQGQTFASADVQQPPSPTGGTVVLQVYNIKFTPGQTFDGTVGAVDFSGLGLKPQQLANFVKSLRATLNWGGGQQNVGLQLQPTKDPEVYAIVVHHEFSATSAQPFSLTLSGPQGTLGSKSGVATAVPAVTPPSNNTLPPQAPVVRPVIATVVTIKVGKKKKLAVRVFYADTGEQIMQILSPFQRPAYRNIQAAVQSTNGVLDGVLVTALKGRKAVRAVFPV